MRHERSRITTAVRHLLDAPGFRANAARLGAIIRNDAVADHAVAELEAVRRTRFSRADAAVTS